MNSGCCVVVLTKKVTPEMARRLSEGSRLFQQDLAPCHVNRKFLGLGAFLFCICLEVLQI